jgi:hypothetical protein
VLWILLYGRNGKEVGEKRGKEIRYKEYTGKKEKKCEGLRYERTHSLLNYYRLYTLVTE